jgi:hypothetical protein
MSNEIKLQNVLTLNGEEYEIRDIGKCIDPDRAYLDGFKMDETARRVFQPDNNNCEAGDVVVHLRRVDPLKGMKITRKLLLTNTTKRAVQSIIEDIVENSNDNVFILVAKPLEN